jgi:hypothetical protein
MILNNTIFGAAYEVDDSELNGREGRTTKRSAFMSRYRLFERIGVVRD